MPMINQNILSLASFAAALPRPLCCLLTLLLLASMPTRADQEEGVQHCDFRDVQSSEPGPLRPGSIFCPLLADPKEIHSFGSFLAGDSPGEFDTEIGAVGIGDGIGLLRRGSVQLSLTAGALSQFDFAGDGVDLINTDFVVGFPITFRTGGFSGRVRVYHQSSHLGDDYLARDDPVERENLSFEAVELLLSQEFGLLRIYGGGEYLFNKDPEDLESWVAHAGVELRPRFELGGGLRPVIALDTKGVDTDVTGDEDWNVAYSARAGLQWGLLSGTGSPGRSIAVLVEYYDGPAPYGQFFREDLEYYGVGVHVF